MDLRISELIAAACPDNLPDAASPDEARLRALVSAKLHGDAKPRRARRIGRTALMAAALAALLAGGALAAVNGGFDWLRGTVAPEFIDDVEPVEQSVSSEGIELAVIAAQRFGDQAVYYVSLRDTAGLGRVGPDIMWQPIFAGGSTTSELIYFDEAAAAAVYEVRADGVGPEGDAAPLRMERFYYGAEEIDAAADIDLAAVPEVSGDDVDALMHDMDAQPLCAIPGTSAGVIAAVYCEGELVVIIDEPPGGTYSQIHAELVTPEGERLTMVSGSSIESDKYRRERTNIAVARDVLAGSTLRFSGTKYSVLEGEWEISVDFGEAEGVLERALDIDAGGELLEDCAVTVSPLGVSLSAPGFDPGAPHERMDIASLKVILTTADGEKDMTQRCSILYTAGRARACWPSNEALDISQVKSLQLGETVIRF